MTKISSSGEELHKVIVRIEDYDDLYACGLAPCQQRGEMPLFADRFEACDCCSCEEEQVIEHMRALLRPQSAPKDFVSRCFECLDDIDMNDDVHNDESSDTHKHTKNI